MFYSLNDRVSYAKWHEHCQNVDKLMSKLPKGISTKLVVVDRELKHQIHYLEDETNFFVTIGGKIFYLEKEYNLEAEMTLSDIVADYHHYLEDEKTG